MYKFVEGGLEMRGLAERGRGEVHKDTHGTRNTTATELDLQLFPARLL